MAYNVTSEWDDIHRKIGNYEPLPVEKSQAEYTKENLQKLEDLTNPDRVLEEKIKDAEANESEDSDLEDDDDAFFAEYKRKQLEKMENGVKENTDEVDQSKKIFRYVKEITAQEYVAEVNNAGEGVSVLLNFYQDYHKPSLKINEVFAELAGQYPSVKFLKSVATKCVPNFSDTNLPYILFYRNGQMNRAFTKADVLAYRNITNETLSHLFAEADVEEFAKKAKGAKTGREFISEVLGLNRKPKEDFSSDEDERADKQFVSNKVFMKY